MRTLGEIARDGRMWASRRLNRSLGPPDWLSVNLTLRCNLACVMCTTCYDAPEMTTAEVLDLIDQAAAWGVRVFNPLGGEAFVRRDLEVILAHASRRDMHVTLTTNATLITPDRAARIALIPAEKLHINVSLDGPEAVHDRVRGAGAFARAMTGYRALREADRAAGNPKRKICANSLLHRWNVEAFPAFCDGLGEDGFDGIQVLTLFRSDEDDSVGGMWLDADSLPALEATIARIRTHPLVLNRPEDLDLVPRYYREGLRPLDAPCWAGWKELYVNADGTTIMCDGKLDFLAGRFGDTRARTLREIWRSPELAARREVVKACTTPCVQGCYLRRESDSARALVREAAASVTSRLRRPRLREVDAVLTLELSDTPDDPDHPLARRLFAGSPVSLAELHADPERLVELRDRKYLDFGRGFMGLDVALRILGEVARAGLRFRATRLSWRGEPLLHPEIARVIRELPGPLELVTTGRLRTRAVDEAVRATGARVWTHGAPPVAGPVISWEGRVTASANDVTLSRRVGDALKEPFSAIWGRFVAASA